MTNEEIKTFEITWEELEEQTRINDLKEAEGKKVPRIRKYI